MTLFRLGQVVATPGAMEVLSPEMIVTLLIRYQGGDWGDVDPEDAQENARALELGERLMGSYTVNGTTLWVITEADRSATTFLLPSEY